MTIDALPSAPLPTDNTATFNSKAFGLVAALDTFVTQANATGAAADSDAASAFASAIAAGLSEDAAIAAANFKGAWSTLSGALAIPASVSHLSKVWILTESVANVTTEVPGTSAKWLAVNVNFDSPGVIGGVTPSVGNFTSVNSANTFGFKNRIINGDMRIDQRNAGASITPSGTSQYTVDRFIYIGTQASKMALQQVSDAPAGFVNSVKLTVASAATPSASDQFRFGQSIEGVNVADLGWGTVNAQPVTVSFRAKASVAGSYSVALWNSANGRSYVTTVPLTTAWASYSFTAPGDTTGTWGTGNGVGIELIFDLGGGSNWVAPTTNAWQGSNYFKASGSVSLVSNAAATLNITGVQLEVGSTATSFDVRDYGRELAMCQRYYYQYASNGDQISFQGFAQNSTTALAYITYPYALRTNPTCSVLGATASNWAFSVNGGNDMIGNAINFGDITRYTACLQLFPTSSSVAAGSSGRIRVNANGYGISFSAEL